ncbi:MAG: NAD(P)H-hydrate dehydratase [Sphingobacteriaceae bacterium]|jgi:NAD(P)H-hydrate epimerase|nr:NAD(P)H-hydrate dehydratase [Sphingobacteriaceae bacterium]
MKTLLTLSQTRNADAFTIANKPITSIDLMEAAAIAFVNCFINHFPDKKSISIYCGTGNNGGDGLAIARLLRERGYMVNVKIAFFNVNQSADFKANLVRLESAGLTYLRIDPGNFSEENTDIIFDALLGSGLSRALDGDWKQLVEYLNSSKKPIVSVDIPTGMPAEGRINLGLVAIRTELAICFQRAKLNFFFPESAEYVRRFEVVDIGLDEGFIEAQESKFKLLEDEDAREILKPRQPFSHKGTYGHALLIAGAKETMGAALLCAEATLRTGSGLTTACIPADGLTALNTRLPEVMALLRDEDFVLPSLEKYSAVAAGPGIGTDEAQAKLIDELITTAKAHLVLDADALNIIAKNPSLLDRSPKGTILTPHMKEFDRLFGEHESWWERVETGSQMAKRLGIVIVLKNRFTFIILPDEQVLINPTGAPNMATGGMGDVLTGMIVSFLAQGYQSREAALLGVYIHGLCAERCGGYVCPASELCKLVPEVMKGLEKNRGSADQSIRFR